jgi:hypothetical protein
MTFREIVSVQNAKSAIYGTALNQNTFAYKMDLVRHTKPKIIVLGSSRVLELREEFFNTSFVNCGLAMNDLKEGKVFLTELFRHHKPEVVILGLDFWWFSDMFRQRTNFRYHENTGTDLTLDKLIKPYTFLATSKISPSDYLRILLFRNDKNHVTNYNNLGLKAIMQSEGFRKDGSYLYASTLAGFGPEDKRIIGFRERLDPKRRFEFGSDLSKTRLNTLTQILNMCISNNVVPVIIIPPVSTMIYKRMLSQPQKYEYVFKFREYLRSLPFENYDFHDITKTGATDCECIDGFHIGDVTYQRILLNILKQNPGSAISTYVNTNLIERMVRANDGKVMTIFETDRGKFNYQEADFLKLGCRKN